MGGADVNVRLSELVDLRSGRPSQDGIERKLSRLAGLLIEQIRPLVELPIRSVLHAVDGDRREFAPQGYVARSIGAAGLERQPMTLVANYVARRHQHFANKHFAEGDARGAFDDLERRFGVGAQDLILSNRRIGDAQLLDGDTVHR